MALHLKTSTLYGILPKILESSSISQTLFLPALISFERPDLPLKDEWRFAGNYVVDRYSVPTFFSSQLMDYGNLESYEKFVWFTVENLGLSNPETSSFEEVRKFGIWRHLNLYAIRARITMEFMKRHRVDYEQYYKDFFEDPQIKLMFDLATYVNR